MEIVEMFTLWSIAVIIGTISLAQYLGDLTGKTIKQPKHTGKIIGLMLVIMASAEHLAGLVF